VAGLLIDIVGAGLVATGSPVMVAAGAGSLILGTGIMVGEHVHNTNAEKKAQQQVKKDFEDCCTGCGIRWNDPQAAQNHINLTYPHAK
jgi:hypothetical protein